MTITINCSVCDKPMGKGDTGECPECGEPMHAACDPSNCESCREVEELELRRRGMIAAKVSPTKTKTPPVASNREVETKPKPSRVEDKEPTPVYSKRKLQCYPKPTDEVTYQEGEYYIIRGLDCPKGGRLMRYRASFSFDVDGFRGFGNTKAEALADLEYYAFDKPRPK